jgi:hypothetical protein
VRELARAGGGLPGSVVCEDRANGELRAWLQKAPAALAVGKRAFFLRESLAATRVAVARMRFTPHEGGTRIGVRYGRLHMVWTPVLVLLGVFSTLFTILFAAGGPLACSVALAAWLGLLLAWLAVVQWRKDDREEIVARLADVMRAMPPDALRFGGGYRIALPQAPVADEEEPWPDSAGEVREQRRR